MADCVVSGTLYRTDNTPFGSQRRALTVQEVVLSGSLYMAVPLSRDTNASGVVTFTVPQGSTAYVYADARGLNTNQAAGVALTIPSASTANLEDLVSVASIPSTGLTIKDEGTALATLIGTVNFVGAGVSVAQSSAGAATVTISSGGSGAWGAITGTLSAQTDLQSALTARALASGGTIVGLTSLGIRSTGAAFDLTLASSEVLTGAKTLSLVLGDTSRTLTIGASASVSGANTGDQTTIAALTTPRAIYGNNFDGTAALTQIIASTFGGTGNGFAKLSGPASTEKTFTLPDATCSILTSNAAVTVGQGGTGVATLAANGVLYGNAAGVVLVTAQGAANSVLTANAGAPAFSQAPILQTSLQIGVVSSVTGALKLAHASSAFLTTIQAGNAAAARTYTWPTNLGAAGTTLTDAAGDGVLSWAAGGSGANTALSNLASVDINTDLLFQATAGVGTAAKPALTLFVGNTTQYESVVQTAGVITHAALGSATNIGITLTPKGTGQLIVPSSGIAFAGQTTSNISLFAAGRVAINAANNTNFIVGTGQVEFWVGANMYATGMFRWSSTGSGDGTTDTGLARNAAGQVAITNGTAGQWGSLFAGTRDASTAVVSTGLYVGHQSTGTPAAGLGSAVQFNINSSTTADQNAAQIAALWLDATHATRTADLVFYTVNSAAAQAETFRIGARGAVTFKVLTFATLPASPVAGMMCGISDSNVATFGTAITAGSGANKGLAYYDGAAWSFR